MAATPMREGLVVVIAGEYRLVPMERVVQIRVHHGTTRIPGAPPWVRGFAVLEGRPVEVFDAARRLGSGELRLNARSCVIFFETGTACAGMLVDAVQRIIAVEGREPCLFPG
jgi:purine-binding chemotaxis protein CheW